MLTFKTVATYIEDFDGPRKVDAVFAVEVGDDGWVSGAGGGFLVVHLAGRLWVVYCFGMNYRDYITIEPGKRGGRPCIRGMRISVYDILGWLAAGMSNEKIIDDFLS